MTTALGIIILSFMLFIMIPNLVFFNFGYETRFVTFNTTLGFWILTGVLLYLFYQIPKYIVQKTKKNSKNQNKPRKKIGTINNQTLLCVILFIILGIILINNGLTHPSQENIEFFQST